MSGVEPPALPEERDDSGQPAPPSEPSHEEATPSSGHGGERQTSPTDTYAEAQRAYSERRYTDAARLFADYTERYPDQGWGYYMLGMASWRAGLPEVAESAFERTLEIDPRHVKSLLNSSRVLLQEGRGEETLAHLELARRLEPGSSIPHRLLGEAYASLGRHREAEAAFRRALERDDRDVWAMNGIAEVRLELGLHEQAMPPAARAIQIRPDVAGFHTNLARGLEGVGHTRAARRVYRTALSIDANDATARHNLARLEEIRERVILPLHDIRALARSFVEEMSSWQQPGPVAVSQTPEPVPSEPPPGEASEGKPGGELHEGGSGSWSGVAFGKDPESHHEPGGTETVVTGEELSPGAGG